MEPRSLFATIGLLLLFLVRPLRLIIGRVTVPSRNRKEYHDIAPGFLSPGTAGFITQTFEVFFFHFSEKNESVFNLVLIFVCQIRYIEEVVGIHQVTFFFHKLLFFPFFQGDINLGRGLSCPNSSSVNPKTHTTFFDPPGFSFFH